LIARWTVSNPEPLVTRNGVTAPARPGCRRDPPELSASARTLIAMSEQPTAGLSLEDRYADLVDELVGLAGVTPPAGGRGFGRSALKFQGRIFAMLVRGHLVLKLPAGRVVELVEAGDGIPFDANKGTPMREWLSLDADSPRNWLALAREALEFSRVHG
jgi:hypothetical protein